MPEKKVRFAEFEVDCTRFRLFRKGEAVRLEGIPLQLLIFLVDHPCELVSREQIAEALWGNGVFVDVETSINTAVRKLRMALDDDSALPKYLQTVVGRGYRFVADVEASEIPQAEYSFSAEEFGRAVIAAAGIEPPKPKKG
ncbi:MAG TPA: winged helix-turn-helix domain-containing protein [Candidatus Sulfotelmatobacter sp.]|nr:winged helix-turn-helix domain-containing protein [Candidatus Sulfotelmatobacter sp.]